MRPYAIAVVAVATCCIGVAGAAASVVAGRSEARPAARTVVVLPAPRLMVASAPDGAQPWQRPLTVTVVNGEPAAVSVTGPTGLDVPGVLGGDTWTSTAQLVPSTAYRVAVWVHRPGSAVPVQARAVVRTTDATRLLHALLSPGDGAVVGIGEPIVVTFNRDVPAASRAAVARRLVVSTSPPQPGGWFWLSPAEMHWRPASNWHAHTRVVAALDLTGLYLGDNVWGASGRHSVTYHIGDAHVSIVNAATHEMTVLNNGRVVRVLPVSTGRDRYPTHSGLHITLDKTPVVTMDSETVGIPRSSPDGYYEQVYWDVRISNSGEFVHAAPWSVADQGSSNVSHGCVNVSTDDARWFYRFSMLGDVVQVVGTPAPPVDWDEGTADWNRPARSLSR